MDVLLAGDDDVVDGAAAVELLHLVGCLPAPVFNPEISKYVFSWNIFLIYSYLPPEASMIAVRTCMLGRTLGVR